MSRLCHLLIEGHLKGERELLYTSVPLIPPNKMAMEYSMHPKVCYCKVYLTLNFILKILN